MFQQVESLSDALGTYLGISEASFDKVVLSLFLMLLLMVLRRATAFVLDRRIEDSARRYIATKTIDFAYPTVRYYDNRGEGKPGRPPDAES